jgi:hypothetical protein
MIANLVNVVLGLALVYVAVLEPAATARRPALLLALAVIMFVAAWLARRGDHHPWQNNTNMVLAVLLALLALLHPAQFPLAVFWIQFSGGSLIAVLALWAALYHPAASAGT